MEDYWARQESTPLFDAILWSRPETKALAGKLLIIGGNDHAFAGPAHSYSLALKTGVGECKVIMPVSVKKLIGGVIPDCEFTPATPSGSFGVKSLDEWKTFAAWSDLTLLAGDFGRNSETAILLETFVTKMPTPLVLVRDAVDYFATNPLPVVDRPDTTLVLSIAQLQKIAMHMPSLQAITFDMDFIKLVAWLHDFTLKHPVKLIVKHHTNIHVAVGGKVTSTKLETDMDIWRLHTATIAAVFSLQHPGQPLESLTTAVHITATGDDEKGKSTE